MKTERIETIVPLILPTVTALAMLLLNPLTVCAENIDPYNNDSQYAFGENIGWLNLEPNQGPGVHVAGDKLTGFVWAENIGWISLSCQNTASCGAVEFGVGNDGSGNLSGFAWGQNVGWIDFNPDVPDDDNHYGVIIDAQGNFGGWAWGENIGWIRFDSTKIYNVRACVVSIDDLANFANDWLKTGTPAANLDGIGAVDFGDFTAFAAYWQDFCPNGWQLK